MSAEAVTLGQSDELLPDIKSRLRSRAMRATTLSVGAVALLMVSGGVAASAVGRSSWPTTRHHAAAAASGPLVQAISDRQPYAYFPLAGNGADAAGHDGVLAHLGAGAAVTHSTSGPAGATGGSIAFHAAAPRSGQYLQTRMPAVPPETIGTVVAWFRIPKTLPGWWQTLLVDNGADTGYGGGFFINDTGRLVISTSLGTYVTPRGNFGSTHKYESGPLNDGRWHMLAYVDQYNIDIGENGGSRPASDWLPSLFYLDGQLVDNRLMGRFLDQWSGFEAHHRNDPSGNAARLMFGAGQANQAAWLGRFTGNLSHVALFTRLLTGKDVAAIWQAGN